MPRSMKSGIELELRCLACGETFAEEAEAPQEDEAFRELENRYFEHVDAKHPELIGVE